MTPPETDQLHRLQATLVAHEEREAVLLADLRRSFEDFRVETGKRLDAIEHHVDNILINEAETRGGITTFKWLAGLIGVGGFLSILYDVFRSHP